MLNGRGVVYCIFGGREKELCNFKVIFNLKDNLYLRIEFFFLGNFKR